MIFSKSLVYYCDFRVECMYLKKFDHFSFLNSTKKKKKRLKNNNNFFFHFSSHKVTIYASYNCYSYAQYVAFDSLVCFLIVRCSSLLLFLSYSLYFSLFACLCAVFVSLSRQIDLRKLQNAHKTFVFIGINNKNETHLMIDESPHC